MSKLQMIPDASKHNDEPTYIRGLIDKIGLSQREIARSLGVSERSLRQYITYKENNTFQPVPYVVQYALECWASQSVSQ